jgi:parvulin-like peptidyl-prolyl isomerase
MEMASASEVAAVFGSGFADDLLESASDGWSGPVASSFGLHLVRIEARTPTRDPDLDEVRQQVAREHESVERTKANRQFLETLREQYEIEIRLPEAEPAAQPSARAE